MNILEDTLSLCKECYRHVPAVRFERDSSIYLGKTCPVHGNDEVLVEPDADFYLDYTYTMSPPASYLLDVTNRCNLACPSCYQKPDNFSTDLSISLLMSIVTSWPDDGLPVSLCGAEATVRNDLPELIDALNKLPIKQRPILIITNAVKLADREFTNKFAKFDNVFWTIGLNHPSYQGATVRKKQMQGLDNLIASGQTIKNISYTLADMSQLEYCLEESMELSKEYCPEFRIRASADIGRHVGGDKIFLSDLVKETQKIADNHNWLFRRNGEGNRAHYGVDINDVPFKLIQWPDVNTLDLKEKQTEAIADVLPGKPRSPLSHQVILRDQSVNNNKPLYDTIPDEYIINYGKWTR